MSLMFCRDALLIASILCWSVLTPPASAGDQVTVQVTTDRADAQYDIGEQVVFRITATRGDQSPETGTVTWQLDDFLSPEGFPGQTVPVDELPVEIPATAEHAGFLRCQVSYSVDGRTTARATAAAAFSPQQIGLSLPVPDDFDEYWAEQKRLLAEVPLDPTLTPVDHADESVQCFDVQTACLGGAPVSGYFARPKQAAARSLPAILWVHGAGVRSSSLGNAVKGASHGMLSMDINAHGIPNGEPKEFYTALNQGELENYRYAGRENRDTSYFRGMYLRLVRAIDFLTAQPEWNGQHVIVIGHSQGGGQSLVAGGLDPRVTLIAPGVPAICDHSGEADGRVNGWPKLVPRGDDGQPDPQILEASRYVDAVNFATRCRAEAIMSVGFIDAVCPPSSCYAAYNALTGSKSVINEPRMGHAAPPHIQTAFFERVLEHIRQPPATSKVSDDQPLIQAISKHTLWRNRDGQGKTWFHPRACVMPGEHGQPVALMNLQEIGGSDYFGQVHWSRSTDYGHTWSEPQPIAGLGRDPLPGRDDSLKAAVCDVTPQYHPQTDTVISLGHVVFYKGQYFARKEQLPRYPVYVTRSADGTWSPRRILEWDDPRTDYIYSNNCGQRVVLPGGDVQMSFTFGATVENRMVCGVRTSFDGSELKILQTGPELTIDAGRGLLEPSVTQYDDQFWITMRAEDNRGYMSVSKDGLHWDEKKPWTWDDGTPLAMSTTQQHWLTHSDGLFLVYTREDASNSSVIRWRSPLWVAQVDPAKRCLIKSTEQVVLPLVGDGVNDGRKVALMGNFNITNISAHESWVTVGEVTVGDYQGNVLLARIRWAKPNRLPLW